MIALILAAHMCALPHGDVECRLPANQDETRACLQLREYVATLPLEDRGDGFPLVITMPPANGGGDVDCGFLDNPA